MYLAWQFLLKLMLSIWVVISCAALLFGFMFMQAILLPSLPFPDNMVAIATFFAGLLIIIGTARIDEAWTEALREHYGIDDPSIYKER